MEILSEEKQNTINAILQETEKFEFPFWANEERKKIIIKEKKQYVEKRLKTIGFEKFLNEDLLIQIWKTSIENTDEKFKMLSDKYKLNSFYLQELLHCYVENICVLQINDAEEMKSYGKLS